MVRHLNKIFLMFMVVIFTGCGRDRPLFLDVSVKDLSNTINDIIPAVMNKADVVGFSVIVIRSNDVIIDKSFGYANLEENKEIDSQTVYKAASLGKPIFGYIVVSLAQQKKIDLDKPLYSYFNKEIVGNDPRSRKITARMVLSHTTGLSNLGNNSAPDFHFEPAEGFKYSGHGYEYLQKVVEKVTDKTLNELATEIVFKPLSMKTSSYVWRKDYENVISSSYDANRDKYKVNREATEGYAAWSLYTTLRDYSKFVIHILEASKMKNSVASQMLVSNADVAKGVKWGLGWGIQDTIPHNSFWHWGSMAGFRHYVVGYPEEELAVIVMANSSKSFKIIDGVMAESIGGSFPSYDWF